MIAGVREALAETVQLALPSVQVSPYILSSPTVPCAYFYPGPVKYDEAPDGTPANARGGDAWQIMLRVMVGSVGDIAAQQLLDQMIEPTGQTSIKAAVERDYTLAGQVFDVTATDCSGYRQYTPTPGSAPVMGADWTITIFADGGGGP